MNSIPKVRLNCKKVTAVGLTNSKAVIQSGLLIFSTKSSIWF